jgi:sulfur relay (sulfurtransferase) DsrF/TusC family protein
VKDMPEEMKLVILLRQPPHGTLYPVEGLRMAVATEEFDPLVIGINDGVYTFLKDTDKTVYDMHIKFLKEIDIGIWVDKQSLEERGLMKSDLIDEVEVKDHSIVHKNVLSANTVIPL